MKAGGTRNYPLWLGAACAFCLVSLFGEARGEPFRGSPDLEPGLEGREDILLFEDFEHPDWREHWTGIRVEENLSIVDDPVFSGDRALEVRVPEGEHDGASLNFQFEDAGLEEPEELYLRYYVRIDSSWHFPEATHHSSGSVGKFPGFSGTYGVAGWGGRPSDGYNGWSARMGNYDDGDTARVAFYTYHVDQRWSSGDSLLWDSVMERNQWYCVEAYIRMNTLDDVEPYRAEDHPELGELTTYGNNDGVLRGWIDDVLVFEREDMRWRHIPGLRIEKVWANFYVGGSFVAEQDMAAHLDNIVISPNRIGCYSDDGGGHEHPEPDAGTSDGGVPDPTEDAGSTRDAGFTDDADAGIEAPSEAGPLPHQEATCLCGGGSCQMSPARAAPSSVVFVLALALLSGIARRSLARRG